jgi:hypothetical protein
MAACSGRGPAAADCVKPLLLFSGQACRPSPPKEICMPKKIGIVTDNTADIPEKLKQALGIHTIPTNIVLDGKVYRDGIDLSSAEFYRNFHHYKTMV